MKSHRVRSLFNTAEERSAVAAGVGKAAAGRGSIALASACYTLWMTACCAGPAAWVAVPGLGGAMGFAAVPAWVGPLFAMAVASAGIALWFRRTRRVLAGRSWAVILASVMTLAVALHLVWAASPGLAPASSALLYGCASVFAGVGASFFRVELDRAFGWIGTQQTLYQGMLGTVCSVVVLMLLMGASVASGRGLMLLCGAALPTPFLMAFLLGRAVRAFPQQRYYGHGLEVPLPFPTKFVTTSAVQGMAAGMMFAALFLLREATEPLVAEALAGQVAGVVLLFATLVFLRLDFNRFIYKVAFSFVAAGFLLVAVGWGSAGVGIVVLAAGFCYLDLVLWSLGACLIKTMGLPATWVASCPGAALFFGAVGGCVVGMTVLAGKTAPEVAAFGSFAACFMLAAALFLSSGNNLKYGWGTVLPGEGVLEAPDLSGIVQFVATERGVSQRETEVMALLVEGLSRRDICEALTVSPDTVKTHVRAVYRKVGVHSQQELVDRILAERDRLMESDHPEG